MPRKKIEHSFVCRKKKIATKKITQQMALTLDPRGEQLRQTAGEVIAKLQQLYFETVKPLEQQFFFHDFTSTTMSKGDFEAKPTVLLVGQYSTGKVVCLKVLGTKVKSLILCFFAKEKRVSSTS